MRLVDRTEHLLEMAVRLREATLERDWAVLTMLNRELREVVCALSAKQSLSEAERSALALVKTAHQSAMAVLNVELERLARQMTGLSEHRTGWDAYSMTDRESGTETS
jgi:methanogenic corrinoid protein MtbC1